MDEVLVQLGVGGCFTLFVLHTVFRFLEKKRNGIPQALAAIQEDIAAIKRERSLQQAIEKLALNSDLQTDILRGIMEELKDQRRDIRSLELRIAGEKM